MLFNTAALVALLVSAGAAAASSHDAGNVMNHEKIAAGKRRMEAEERSQKMLYVSLPGAFSGVNSGIGSWFRSNSGTDSTNGISWCNIKYENWMPLFAPKFSTMSPSLATWGTDPATWKADATKFCGLEAEVEFNGNKKLMYIGDAFDDQWCRTDGSIDILTDAWQELSGKSAASKQEVMQGLTWKLTGKKNPAYAFQG